ncbi:YncE family protein (plasmid) [Roseovarius pelagicus]|uniref:YncE family protein n=1 Tax=Roseovarius pelagicus TaxID=2980108 RepID=A0ABY6DGK7_9RHOB|nr:YncE family protein [Roseovarius pelagicus]
MLSLTAALLTSSAALADLYIPEGETGTLLHLDRGFEIVARIPGLDNVHGLAGAPERGLLVAGSLSESMPGEVAKPAAVSDEEHAAHHGGGTKTVPESVRHVTLMDVSSQEILRRIEVPGIVHHVEVSADERYAVVTHPTSETVSVIDLESGEVTATVATGPIPEYAVADPVTGNFFVSNAGNDTISVLDPRAGIVDRNFRLDGPPKHMILDAGARRLFVSQSDVGRVAILDADSGETLESFEIGGELHGIAVDETAIWSSARERDRVVRIDRESGERLEVEVGPEPYHMMRVENALVVSSAEDAVIWVLDPTTLELRNSVTTQSIAHQMVEMP